MISISVEIASSIAFLFMRSYLNSQPTLVMQSVSENGKQKVTAFVPNSHFAEIVP